jgi:hypothetical protein
MLYALERHRMANVERVLWITGAIYLFICCIVIPRLNQRLTQEAVAVAAAGAVVIVVLLMFLLES